MNYAAEVVNVYILSGKVPPNLNQRNLLYYNNFKHLCNKPCDEKYAYVDFCEYLERSNIITLEEIFYTEKELYYLVRRQYNKLFTTGGKRETLEKYKKYMEDQKNYLVFIDKELFKKDLEVELVY
jgi:hypothetical protein